jgi:hypothetical protein
MPGDRERGGLIGVKRPLVEAAPVTDPAAERTVLAREVIAPPAPVSSPPPPPADLTKPATFHLPLALLQRLRATCRLKNTTMVEFVRQAIEEALERQRPTEEEIRRLLGS